MELRRAVPILTVTDVDAAVQEYSELLGLDVLMNLGWVATLGTNGGAAQFSVMDVDQSAPCNPQMSVEVPDVDDAYQRARDRGVEIVHPLQDEAWGVRRFFLRTSAGHVVNVLSHHE
jgi:predicted enzyme related to lactoylglutathione lyase